MYVYKRQVPAFQGIATLLALALVLWAVGAHMFTKKAEASNLTSISDLLTDSDPGASSVHTITFTTPNGMSATETFEVTWPNGAGEFDGTSLVIGDVSVTVNGNASSTGVAAGADTFGITGFGTETLTWTVGTGGVASNSVLVLTIGSESGTMITNPTATSSYEITVGGGASTIQDSGQTRVAIIENVLVTADINTTFSFTVNGTTTNAVINGADPTDTASTNTTIPFGTLGANDPQTIGQDLTVATNAIHGYVVTVEQSQQLESSTGADIDGFRDGNWTTIPENWAQPSNTITDEDTWGHWGLTSSDATTTRTNEFGTDQWVAASTTPVVIMSHDGPADGTTDGTGRASVAYQVEITALQEAGDDYNTTLTYIATPTF